MELEAIPEISKGKQIAQSQRVGYLEPDECVLFCEMLKKVKITFREQAGGDVRLIRVNDVKFYSDKTDFQNNSAK